MGEAASDLAVETCGLRKQYGDKVAVADLSLAVPRGSIFGFLGPNGAGKSTSIKMLLGLVRPSAGQARLLGSAIGDRRIRRLIGFLPEQFRFYEWLTPAELLVLHGRLCGLSRGFLAHRVPQMLELVGLGQHRDRRIHDFSKGMMQRIGLAQALIHEPQLIFLDEPTSGLDPIGRRMVRDVIRAQQQRGTTVFLNSHLLSEVEVICDTVVLLKDGRVVANRQLQQLQGDAVSVTIQIKGLPAAALSELGRRGCAPRLEGERLELTATSRDALAELHRYLAGSGAQLYAFTPHPPSLEELFLQVVGEDRGQ
ncbi:MAG: ATP-binding cassette domain-containing protein [Steroidobacteraceae bacterium]